MHVTVNNDVPADPSSNWRTGDLIQRKSTGSIFLLTGAEGVEFNAMLMHVGDSMIMRGFREGQVRKIRETDERLYIKYQGSITIRN